MRRRTVELAVGLVLVAAMGVEARETTGVPPLQIKDGAPSRSGRDDKTLRMTVREKGDV